MKVADVLPQPIPSSKPPNSTASIPMPTYAMSSAASPITRVAELLPWNWTAQPDAQAA
jgi:hypothetical protein